MRRRRFLLPAPAALLAACGRGDGSAPEPTVRRAGAANLLCPTSEAGFEDNGWLLR